MSPEPLLCAGARKGLESVETQPCPVALQGRFPSEPDRRHSEDEARSPLEDEGRTFPGEEC